MAKGKAPESAEFKKAYESFCALSEEEQVLFRSKVFSKVCSGLTNDLKSEVKADRKALLDKIEQGKKIADQLKSVSSLSTETLKSIIAEREKAAK